MRDQRFTDNGKFLTSAGLSSGIDASIHLVGKIEGDDAAQSLALHLEYEWNRGDDEGFVRGALADRHLPSLDLDLPEDTEIRQLTSLGDMDTWTIRLAVDTSLDANELLGVYRESLTAVPSWKERPASESASPSEAVWRIETEEDGAWLATGSISDDPGNDRLLVELTLERAST